MAVKPEDIDRAIAIVRESRHSHVTWMRYREQGGTESEAAGDEGFHRDMIGKYDFVLSVLSSFK